MSDSSVSTSVIRVAG